MIKYISRFQKFWKKSIIFLNYENVMSEYLDETFNVFNDISHIRKYTQNKKC